MKTSRSWWLAGALVAALAAASTAQPAGTGTVTGSVLTAAGQPVAGATVVLGSDADSKYLAQTTANSQGRFTITGVPLGTVLARVVDEQRRVLARGKGVLRKPGETLTLDLQTP